MKQGETGGGGTAVPANDGAGSSNHLVNKEGMSRG